MSVYVSFGCFGVGERGIMCVFGEGERVCVCVF